MCVLDRFTSHRQYKGYDVVIPVSSLSGPGRDKSEITYELREPGQPILYLRSSHDESRGYTYRAVINSRYMCAG